MPQGVDMSCERLIALLLRTLIGIYVCVCAQSLNQLLAGYTNMAEYLIADAATVQRLRSASKFKLLIQLMRLAYCAVPAVFIQFVSCTWIVALTSAATIATVAIHLCVDASSCFQLRRSAEFDLVLRDTWFWPGALIQDMLGIDSVELCPTAISLPWLYEKEYSIPNPIAYIPQFAKDYTPRMVQLTLSTYVLSFDWCSYIMQFTCSKHDCL